MSIQRKINVKFIIFVMGIFFSYLILTTLSIWNYKDIDEKQQADVVIVLGASTYNNEVSLVFKERLNHGIWLYKNNYVKKLIFTGGIGEKNKYSDAFIAKQYAIKCGIPAKDIFIEEKSWEELTLYQKSDIFIKALNAIFGFVKLCEKKNIDSKNLCQF